MAWKSNFWLKYVCTSMEFPSNLIFGHAHALSHGILNTHGLPYNGQSPMNGITQPDILVATTKSLHFNIEWENFNSSSPFTILIHTCKFAASTTYVWNVARFVDSPPTFAWNFNIFFKTHALSLPAQKFEWLSSAHTTTYSPSPKIAAALLTFLPEAMPLSLPSPLFCCLPLINYIAW